MELQTTLQTYSDIFFSNRSTNQNIFIYFADIKQVTAIHLFCPFGQARSRTLVEPAIFEAVEYVEIEHEAGVFTKRAFTFVKALRSERPVRALYPAEL